MSEYQFLKIKNSLNFKKYISDIGLVDIYCQCFREPPYNESFSQQYVIHRLKSYTKHGLLIVCFNKQNQAVGFCAAIPLRYEKEVCKIAKKNKIETGTYWYYADLGVRKDYRRKGLALSLGKSLIDAIPSKRIIMRTQENNVASISCNQSIGFEILKDMEQIVLSKRVNGMSEKDRRIFLVYKKE